MACTNPQEIEARKQRALADSLATANQLLYEGHTEQALKQLELIAKKYPSQAEVIEALAFAYARKPGLLL